MPDLPDFVVIGAQKAGTSTIYSALQAHQEVFMPKRTEIGFFARDLHFREGVDYYKSFFTGAAPLSVVGEVSPDYLASEVAAERMSRLMPDVKLVACLRNPIERAYSAWLMQISKGSETRPFAAAVRANPIYIAHSLYGRNVARFLKQFSRNQLLILQFEWLRSDPQRLFDRLAGFLGVQAFATDEIQARNAGGIPRFNVVTRALNIAYQGKQAILKSPLKACVDNLFVDRLSRRVRNQVAAWNRSRGSLGEMDLDSGSSGYLQEVFLRDLEQLEQRIDFDTSGWRESLLKLEEQ